MENVFTIENLRPIRDGMTVSRDSKLGTSNMATFFSMGKDTSISQESYDRMTMYIGAAGSGTFIIGNDKKKLTLTPDTAKTNGEKLYLKYKITGIRGEAKEGFPLLFNVGFPLFQAVLKKGFSLWQAGLITLLHYIACTEDTNLIIRSDYQLACKIQKDLQQFLAHATYEKQLSILPKLDAFFVSRNISPGGSADMLALTYFLYFIQNIPCPFL